nr:MAG TPA: hypothetical protein [Caudoviricetes sp.]
MSVWLGQACAGLRACAHSVDNGKQTPPLGGKF